MTDIRKILAADQPYWSFCREERNLAAIFYHMLLCGDNLQLFCQSVGYGPRLTDPAVYFEYAYLRDLWFQLGGGLRSARLGCSTAHGERVAQEGRGARLTPRPARGQPTTKG